MAKRNASVAPNSTEFVEGSAEAIPLDDASVDTVVTTWTLCSIPDARRALSEMRRVLKPSGRLLFVEHGRAPDDRVRWWQERLNPIWTPIAGGCRLDRPIANLIGEAGFPHRGAGDRIRPRPQADDLHVRGQRATTVG